jgi:hypothetical protein
VLGAKVLNEASEEGRHDRRPDRDPQPEGTLRRAVGRRLSWHGHEAVVVPYDTMKTGDKNMVLPGATRDSLKVLPECNYAK